MKLFYSIRFKLLASILFFIIIFAIVLGVVAVHFGKKQLDDTGKLSRAKIMENTKRWSTILAHLTFGSLRESMAKYDVDAMRKIVEMARSQKNLMAVRIFGPKLGDKMQGEVRFNGDTPDNPKEVDNISCAACHSLSGLSEKGLQQKAEMVDAQARIDSKEARYNSLSSHKSQHDFEMIIHVYNQQDPCWQCHKATQKVNGVLQVNISLADVDEMLDKMNQQVEENKRKFEQQVVFWGIIFAFVIGLILFWIATSIVNKVAKLRYVAERVSLGETDVTLEDIPVSKDEIGELRDSFERMLVAVKFFMMPEEESPEESL